jgi:hypothetical protein
VGGVPAIQNTGTGNLPIAVQLTGCPYRASAMRVLKDNGVYYRVLLESANSTAVEAAISCGLAVGMIEESRVTPDLTVDIPGAATGAATPPSLFAVR